MQQQHNQKVEAATAMTTMEVLRKQLEEQRMHKKGRQNQRQVLPSLSRTLFGLSPPPFFFPLHCVGVLACANVNVGACLLLCLCGFPFSCVTLLGKILDCICVTIPEPPPPLHASLSPLAATEAKSRRHERGRDDEFLQSGRQ